jgi:hypothetical protein
VYSVEQKVPKQLVRRSGADGAVERTSLTSEFGPEVLDALEELFGRVARPLHERKATDIVILRPGEQRQNIVAPVGGNSDDSVVEPIFWKLQGLARHPATITRVATPF